MINFNCRSSLRPLLFASALPLGCLVPGAMSAHAGTVTVTGANGANGHGYYLAGPGQSAAATTTTPSDQSNTATATGGTGGSVPFCSMPSECVGGSGGNGGAANSTATTIRPGAATAEATSFGGAGGNGKGWNLPAPGGKGGAASSSASASSTTGSGSASATANSTGGHGGRFFPGNGGAASSSAAASNTTGSASATANSTGGAAAIGPAGGAATASANAQNSYGAALTSASAPASYSAIAVTNAAVETVGSGTAPLITIVGGQSASVVRLVPGASDFATGAMSAGTSGGTASLEYSDTSVIDFSLKSPEIVHLVLLGYNVLGAGFSSLQLTVSASNNFDTTYPFATLASAEKFFTNDQLDLGSFTEGSQFVDMSYLLTASGSAQGFGFNFNIDPELSPAAVPEPSTWAMMLMGFAGLAFAALRRARETPFGV